MSEPRTIAVLCTGWFRYGTRERVHDDVRVLVPGDSSLPASHGACLECGEAMAPAHLLRRRQEAAHDLR